MNIGRIKALCWLAVVGLVGYLGYDVGMYFHLGKHLPRYPSQDEQRRILDVEEPPEETRELVAYARVQETFFDLNWTGKKAPVVVATTPKPVGPKMRDATAVADLLTVVMIQFLSSDSSYSQISVRYKPVVPSRGSPDAVLHEGDRLPGKFSFIQLTSIQPDYVEFVFDEAEEEEPRDPERVRPPEYLSPRGPGTVHIALVDPNGKLIEPDVDSGIGVLPQQPRFNPDRTRETRKNQFEIGDQDAGRFGREYTEILTREVRTSRYRDPNTGRYAGIQIKSLLGGSIVAQHGLMAGDIVKSINGEPVTSTNEAHQLRQDSRGRYDALDRGRGASGQRDQPDVRLPRTVQLVV